MDQPTVRPEHAVGVDFADPLPFDAGEFFAKAAQERALLAHELQAGMALPEGYPSRRGNIQRRCYKGSIIRTVYRNGRKLELHATKSWRSYRAA